MSGITRERVLAALARIDEVERPEVWIHLASREELLEAADAVDEGLAGGRELPLAGLVAAVKDNIDVAGMPTTAGARSFSYVPSADSTAVARLRAAGAVVVGKTNLDQFATGLVGTRSPFGAVRNAWDATRISGGSSAGSAVAVALGIVDLALGTDTAGSGRVPAALNGIVGVKPTPGLIPVAGVVPACRSIDCVTVFARRLGLARRAVELLQGVDPDDPMSRPDGAAAALPASPRIAVPDMDSLGTLAPGWAEAFAATTDALRSAGAQVEAISLAPMLEAAAMLYGSSFVAERYAAVGSFIEGHEDLVGTDLDPTVAGIILAGRDHSAAELYADQERLRALTARALALLAPFDALLTPTTVDHPTIAEVEADPVGRNSALGRFTNFANLMGMCAVAVPAGEVAGLPFGVMVTGRGLDDRLVAQVGELIVGRSVRLMVFGLHRRGQPLNGQLVSAGADYLATARTMPEYRLRLLRGDPARPALVASPPGTGVAVEGELWQLSAKDLGLFLSVLPEPMSLGSVRLSDGSTAVVFRCAAGADDLLDEVGDRWPVPTDGAARG